MVSPPEPVAVYVKNSKFYLIMVFAALTWLTLFVQYKNLEFEHHDYFYSFFFWGSTIGGFYFLKHWTKTFLPYRKGANTPYLNFSQNSVSLRGEEIPWSSVTSIRVGFKLKQDRIKYFLVIGFRPFHQGSPSLADSLGRDSSLSVYLDDLTLTPDQIASVVKTYAEWINLGPDKVAISLHSFD